MHEDLVTMYFVKGIQMQVTVTSITLMSEKLPSEYPLYTLQHRNSLFYILLFSHYYLKHIKHKTVTIKKNKSWDHL